MIPITTFAGQRAAIFGLGSSGLAAARALAAGGAEVVAWDDDKKKIAEGQAAGLKTQDLNGLDWSKSERPGAGTGYSSHASEAALDSGSRAPRQASP